MQVNPKILKQKFEKSMPKYNENALVQKEMAQKLIELLKLNCGNEFLSILELGSGTGVLTELIVKNLAFKEITCNDIVEKSRFYLDKILKNYKFITGNSTKIKPSGHFDLIISNAMFQWFSSLEQALGVYLRMLNKGDILAFSTFSTENFREIRDILGLSLNYLSIEEIRKILEKEFEVLELTACERVVEFNNSLELLAHLKNTGVNSLSAKKMQFGEVKAFCEALSKFDKPALTYAPVIVIARRK